MIENITDTEGEFEMSKQKLAIAGTGFLGSIVADAWKAGYLDEYELVGVFGRNREYTEALAARVGCKAFYDMDEMLALKPDYVAEAASGQWVREYAEKVSNAGAGLILISIGAFADEELYERIKKVNRENNTKVYLASGAVGGFDVLRTISLMGDVKAKMESDKNPMPLYYTPLFKEPMLTEKSTAFDGSAKEAIAILPHQVNVTVAAALATAGPENTNLKITTIPGYIGDDHKITAEVPGVKAVVDIYSSTSAIAGWSIVAVLQNIVSPIVF